MTAPEKMDIWCITNIGDPRPFLVEIYPNRKVYQLLKSIQKERLETMGSLDTGNLVLHQVKVRMRRARDGGSMLDTAIDQSRDGTTELEMFEDILSLQNPGYVTAFVTTLHPQDAKYTPTLKADLDGVYPDGLEYVPPQPLLHSYGGKWHYQMSTELGDTLGWTLNEHYANFSRGFIDKVGIPTIIVAGAPGSGKSRMASEYHALITGTAKRLGGANSDLYRRLSTGFVFHTSFENGTSKNAEDRDLYSAVGSRMLLQCQPGSNLPEIQRKYGPITPLTILELVARKKGGKIGKDLTAIVVVDGIHNLIESEEDGLDTKSRFYTGLNNLADLTLCGGFVLLVCTATVVGSLDGFLARTNRSRFYLSLTPLKNPTVSRKDGSVRNVFDISDKRMQLLVEDCGGHGRALEHLGTAIRSYSKTPPSLTETCDEIAIDFKDQDPDAIVERLRQLLLSTYEDVLRKVHGSSVTHILRAILCRAVLQYRQKIPGTELTPEELCCIGLIRFVPKDCAESQHQHLATLDYGYLVAPYIWVWLVLKNKPIECGLLANWTMHSYKSIFKRMDPTIESFGGDWEGFESFVAIFRCLRSRLWEDGENTTILQLHAGARFNLPQDITFTNRHLSPIASSRQITKAISKQAGPICIDRNDSSNTIDLSDGQHCVRNGKGAPAADIFLGIPNYTDQSTVMRREYGQVKLLLQTSKMDFVAERTKSAEKDDFMMFYTTKDVKDTPIPENCGVVDIQNWACYFGPFAGRAYAAVRGLENLLESQD